MSHFLEGKTSPGMAQKNDAPPPPPPGSDAAGGGEVDVAQARAYMRERVDPVMSELLTALVVDQPEDVLGYVVAFCNGKKERDPEVRRKRDEVARQFGRRAERAVTPPGKYKSKTYGGRHVSYSGTAGGGGGGEGAESGEGEEGVTSEEGGARRAPLTAAERREAMLAAAEKRSRTRAGGRGVVLSEEKKKELAAARKRDEMVGRIRAMYASAGVDEPFGLGMARTEVLEMHYARAKGFARGGARAQAKSDRMAGIKGGLKL
jgi:hypothetical protein